MKRHFSDLMIEEYYNPIRFAMENPGSIAFITEVQKAHQRADSYRAAGKRIRAYLSGRSIHEVINANSRFWDGTGI